MKTFLKLCLFFSAGILLAGCSDSDGNSDYKVPEWLHITTRDAYLGSILNHDREDIVTLIFYGEPTQFLTLLNAKITIFPVSKPPCHFGDLTENGYIPMSSLPIDKIYRHSLELPDCEINNSFEAELELLTENGVYDFYFRIENPEAGIYYQTPVYRLNLIPDGEEPTQWFTSSIEVLN